MKNVLSTINAQIVCVQLPVFGGCVQEPQAVSGEHDAAVAREKKGHRGSVQLYQHWVKLSSTAGT